MDVLIAALYSGLWDLHAYDERLRRALGTALPAAHLLGVVARIGWRGTRIVFGVAKLRPPDRERLLHELIEQVETLERREALGPEPAVLDLSADIGAVAIRVSEEVIVGRHGPTAILGAGAGYCATLFSKKDRYVQAIGVEWFCRQHAASTLPIIFDVVKQRERRFAPFSARLSESYWSASQAGADPSLVPPWQTGSIVTTTLCFDVRKSTFCMEQAKDLERFGFWLDELVQILAGVTHLNSGVFDKFTGDGALAHFLDDVSFRLDKIPAIDAAAGCAVDMKRAFDIHLERLRDFLHFDSTKLGAGIAVDRGAAFWSFDYRDNPIAVGESVVGACRVCDSAAAGSLRMTNSAYRELSPAVRSVLPAERVSFESKEYKETLGVVAWELRVPPPHSTLMTVGHSIQAIAELCEGIYRRSDEHRRLRQRQGLVSGPSPRGRAAGSV